MSDLISRDEAIEAAYQGLREPSSSEAWERIRKNIVEIPPSQQWIPVSERLPKINQNVLLSTNCGGVFIGHRAKPDLVWQVTESDGSKHWVYDPEAYTDNIDELPREEDISFESDNKYEEAYLSVTSINFSYKSVGIAAWQYLPEPYKGEE